MLAGIKIYTYFCKNKSNNMPTVLFIFGLRFYFYSAEHEPIHIHVVSADGKAKFALEPSVELVLNQGMKPKDIKRALTICEEFREEFIEKWHEYFKN